jgi:hypothetical protein
MEVNWGFSSKPVKNVSLPKGMQQIGMNSTLKNQSQTWEMVTIHLLFPSHPAETAHATWRHQNQP